MKKTVAALLAVSMLLAITACNKNSGSSTEVTDSPSSTTETEPVNEDGLPVLSNPVKRTPDGEIDMTAALSYTTDFDALKAELSSREVDPA
ncbi:MAG: beta-mannanase, partial [Oscillospiraceae bacterium]|nr:beta-mannanase [Oscillospiraceae bacterium]